jgi:hypothetical protein
MLVRGRAGRFGGPLHAGVTGDRLSNLCSYVRHGGVDAPMEACPRPDRLEI